MALKTFKRGAVAAFMAVLIWPITASAETAAAAVDSLPMYQLGEILVIGTREQPARATQVELNRERLALTGSPTVSEALAQLPGAIVTTGTKGCAQLSVRGFLANETTVLLDGRPLNTPYYGDIDLNAIPLFGLSHIQLLKGPASSVFGANTLGGVVNMVTGKVEPGSMSHDYRVAFGPGGRRDASAAYGMGYGKLSIWGATGFSEANAVPLSSDFYPNKLEGGNRRNNSDNRHFNLDGKVSYEAAGGTLLTLGVGHYKAERGAPPTTDTTVATNRINYDRFPEWTRDYVNLNGSGAAGRSVVWRTTVYYDNQMDRLIRYADNTYDEENVKFDSRHDSEDWGLRAEATSILKRELHLTLGGAWRRDAIDRKEDADEAWVYNDADTWSLFAQSNYTPWQRVTVDAGIAFNGIRSDGANASAHSLHPHAALTVTPRNGLKVHGAVARATRFPTLHHLYSNTSGNPDLNPEQAIKFEVGAQFEPVERLSVTQNVFWNDIDDLIDRASKVDTFQNINEVRLRGTETSVEWKTPDLTLGAALGYIEAHSYTPDASTSEVIQARRPWIPELKFDYTISAALPGRFRVDHLGHLVSDRVNSSGLSMPDYYTAQVRASRPVLGKLTAFVDVHNVFDVNYETETGYPEAGRLILFGFEFRDRQRQ